MGVPILSKVRSILQDKVFQRLAKLLGLSFILRTAWAIINFLVAVCLARWLSANDYGVYAVVMSVVTQAAVFCSFGGPAALIRFLGQYHSQAKPSEAKGVIFFFRRWAIGVSVFFSVAASAVAIFIQSMDWIDNALPFIIGFTILPAFVVADLHAAIARSYGAVFTALAPKDVLWRSVTIPLAYACAKLVEPTYQLEVFLASAALALTIISFAQKKAVDRLMPHAVTDSEAGHGRNNRRDWIEVARPIWIASLASIAFASLDVVTLGLFLESAEVGRYFAASRTAALMTFFLTIINLVVGPDIAKYFYSDSREDLGRTLRFSAYFVFLPTLACFSFFAIAGKYMLSWFGDGFVSAYPQLVILSAGQLVNAATGSVRVVFETTGHQNFATKVVIATAIVTSVTMFILAAVTSSATVVAGVVASGIASMNLILWYFARKRLGVDPSLYGAIFGQPKRR